ncbi:hypothetical protein [Enterococcus sp. AZ126]|uniref:hypothetical protein n=1 Tax=Enterococcus sp. AZ126 TaxID=2774635 RepID=UPI003F28C4F8
MFSSEFEQKLFNYIKQVHMDMLRRAEMQANNLPEFIKQKNVENYYDGISINTLHKYEQHGLKRCKPIEDGSVYYQKKELERFMLNNIE